MTNATDFYLKELAKLKNARVTGLIRSGEDKFGDEFFGLQFTLPSGEIANLFFLSDDEGNAPGSFEFSFEESDDVQ